MAQTQAQTQAQATSRRKHKRARALFVALSVLLFSAHATVCLAQNEEAEKLPPMPTGTELSRAKNFEVMYVTTRANEGSPLKPAYGARRNLDLGAGSLEYGTCRIERPASALTFQASANFPQFKSAMAAADRDWLSAPMKRVDRLSMPDFLVRIKNWRGPIMVFIHGYDESFDKAMKDAAMIAYQYDCKGDSAVLPISFSWPSLNNKAEYAADEANLEWSTPAFFEFIDTIKTAKNPSSPLDVVAHSMGNRPVIGYCFQHRADTQSFRNIVLSGGDIDYHTAEARKQDIEAAAERSVTIIVSDRDAPLITSQILHGQPRLGRPIDPPHMRAAKSELLGSSFWSQLTLDASALIVPNTFNMDPDVGRWMSANPTLGREFGEKTIFIDVTDLVAGEMGHRLAFPVIAGILRETLAPLSTSVVYKRPDKLTLEAMGGSPRWLYRFHKIDSSKFRQ